MRQTPDELIEQQQFFAISADLVKARRADNSEDIAHHIDELEILRMHTESPSLRRACTRLIDDAHEAVAVRA